ncbi:MAG: M28 family peptidase [Sphingobacteriales bacterium]|nr:M28 family peptidase [Sphingobacteriales bacterium]
MKRHFLHYTVAFYSFLFSSVVIAADTPPQENDFLSQTRQLIYEGKRSGEGYFSPDGRYLIFQSEREAANPFYQIYALDLESGDVQRVSPGKGKTTCAFFMGNSQRVIFASSHEDPQALDKQKAELEFRASGNKRRYSWDYEPAMDIFSANADGSDLKNLTHTKGYDAEGGVSPDGKLIVFCSNRSAFEQTLSPEDQKKLEIDPAYFGEIYLMNVDGSQVRRLTQQKGYDGGPFFSPDGKRIIWRHFEEKGIVADVFSMNLDGSDVQRLTDFGAMSWAPYYHPSQEYFIFASNKLGFSNFELYIADVAGKKEPVRITYTDGFDGLPVFSPDGKKLCWTSSRTTEGNAQLFFANWNHEAALRALAGAAPRSSSSDMPDMSPHAHHSHEQADMEATAVAPHTAVFSAGFSVNDFKEKVNYLASDELQGRGTGSQGIEKAAQYISAQFQQQGLLRVKEKYLYGFDYTAGVSRTADNRFSVDGGKQAIVATDTQAQPISYSQNGTVSAAMVFVGYGVKLPEGLDYQYNSYKGLNVQDKIVLVLEGAPDFDSASQQDELQTERYTAARYKAMLARDMGAKAIVFIGEVELFSFDGKREGGTAGLAVWEISENFAQNLLGIYDKDIKTIKRNLKTYNPHGEPETFELMHLNATLLTELKKQTARDNNIVALVPAAEAAAPYIVIGAHYDHLGHGEHGGSRAVAGEEGAIHNGADDNASGTAMVMELAEYFADLQKKSPEKITKNLVFALWSGEEMGLLGSQYFCENLPFDAKNIAAYFNFDMVGRMKDNSLIIQGVGSAAEWKKLAEKKNIAAGFNLALTADPYLPTDATSFYKIGVPVVNFFTGLHDDYHRPTDDADKLNYADMERTAQFAANLIQEVSKPETTLTYQKTDMSNTQQQVRSFSVYLGTIPDYAAEVEGVKLSGVRGGSPAEKAGLQGGDIIKKLADKDIKNIYDYTYILSELKPALAVPVVIEREGTQQTLSIIPLTK